MRRCWLLIITKGLRVWMPPEVYLEFGMATREARRWAMTLSRRRNLPNFTGDDLVKLPRGGELHLIEAQFLEPWRACPMWVGVQWSSKAGAALRTEQLALDAEEAVAWVAATSKGEIDPGSDAELRIESTWEGGGVRHYVAVHRLKRFAGF